MYDVYEVINLQAFVNTDGICNERRTIGELPGGTIQGVIHAFALIQDFIRLFASAKIG